MSRVQSGQSPAAGVHLQVQFIGRVRALVSEQAVTEGIETPEQRELREAAGCDVGQGFLLGRPADAAVTTQLLAARA